MRYKYLLRTRFAKDIVAEFLPPAKPSHSVIIYCGGMPGLPDKQDLVRFFRSKNYWVFYPRYRGSWESVGKFLKISPHQDILDIIDQLPKGFKDLWDNKVYKVSPKKLYLLGTSFGGPAQLLASRDPRVTKAVSLSPMVDWRAPSQREPHDFMWRFITEGFGDAYRMAKPDWKKLGSGKFYNPLNHVKEMDGSKILLVHAADDQVVSAESVKKFTEATGSTLIMLKNGGHLSSSLFMDPRFYKRINKFLKS